MRWARAEVVRRRGGAGARGAMVCQRGAGRVRRRGGLGRNARGRGARRVGDAGRWFVSGVRCRFGDAAGWGVTRGRGAGPWCGACWRRGGQGRAGLGRNARGRGAGRVGDAAGWGVGLAASRRRLLPAIHLAPESAFQAPPGHISSRDGADLCPSRTANPSRQHSRAHSLAR